MRGIRIMKLFYKKAVWLVSGLILIYFFYNFFIANYILEKTNEVYGEVPYSFDRIYTQNGKKVDLSSKAINVINNCYSREGKSIKYIILHYTVGHYKNALCFLAKVKSHNLGIHYLITEREKNVNSGEIIRLAPEKFMVKHAGQDSRWGNTINLNFESIGIENVNKGFIFLPDKSKRWFIFDEKQMDACAILVRDIAQFYNIKPQNILAHADVAPRRKSDPGPLFPWGVFYHKYGVGAWLTDEEIKNASLEKVSLDSFLDLLKKYGYNVDPSQDVSIRENKLAIWSFQAHFSKNQKPELCTGVPDQDDLIWIVGLLKKYINN